MAPGLIFESCSEAQELGHGIHDEDSHSFEDMLESIITFNQSVDLC